jgi:hypothetical protein
MAQDQLCKFCEDSEDPERGVLLICDLTGSGELPFAIGINCLPDWLTTMLEAIAIPEGIPASAPAELDEEDEDFPFEVDEVIVVAHEKAEAIDAVFAEPEDPTAIPEPSGPSPVESSAPDTGNGSGKTLSKARKPLLKMTE